MSNTTFFHGPGQPAGGVKGKVWVASEKCANVNPLKRVTTQRCPPGRSTSGSAVTSNWVPICRFVLWAARKRGKGSAKQAATRQHTKQRRGRVMDNSLIG